MIVICKINKLKGLKLISEKTHNYLIDLYKRKIDIEYYLCVYDLTEEETQNYESELIEINNYLEKYDLLPNVSFDNLIEKSVKKIDYSSLNDNKAMSLTPLKK